MPLLLNIFDTYVVLTLDMTGKAHELGVVTVTFEMNVGHYETCAQFKALFLLSRFGYICICSSTF